MFLNSNSIFNYMRYDCILVWGHGLPYLDDILREISKVDEFKIVRIQKYKPSNMSTFVRKVYAYDYAPFNHLKAKTKYLKKVKNEVCLIFIKNLSPDEDYLGQGAFRHVESKRLKRLKECLRDKFNQYKDGVRTHDHILHATDNQKQTNQLLDIIGIKQGVDLFKLENDFIDMPYHLKDYSKFVFRNLNVTELYCTVINGTSWNRYTTDIVKICDSPQYRALSEGFDIYKKYLEKFRGGPLKDYYDVDKYKKLSNNFSYLNLLNKFSYVLVEKNLAGNYVIKDGLHRASIIAFNGGQEIRVCQLLK